MPSVQEATKLVEDIDEAILTGHGDVRSNAVIAKLLNIARHWIAEHTASDAASTDSAPAPQTRIGEARPQTIAERVAACSATAGKGKSNGKQRGVANTT